MTIEPTWPVLATGWGIAVVLAFEWSVSRASSRQAPVEDPAPLR